MSDLLEKYRCLLKTPGYSFVISKQGVISKWTPMEGKNSLLDEIQIVPGSFNPLHQTHREIYKNAQRFSSNQDNIFFEISVERIGKDAITFSELKNRVKQFCNYANVIVSNAPRFIEKIGTFAVMAESINFHVGIDCITRMRDDYGKIGIQGLNATFTVYDRIVDGKLHWLEAEFGHFHLSNCTRARIVRSQESLAMSSTKIKEKQR